MRLLGVVFALAAVLPAAALAADPIASTGAAVATGASTATVDGSVDPGGLATTYRVEYGPASSTWCASAGTIGAPASSTAAHALGFTDTASHSASIGVSGLTPATSYCLDLVATNSSGSGDGGQISLTAGVPTAYSSDAIATGASTATVDGSVDPSGQITTYVVQYDLASSTWCLSGEALGSPANSTPAQTLGFADATWHNVSIDLSALTSGSSYCVDLVATNAAGTTHGGQISLAPGTPSTYTADAVATGTSTATVDGNVNPSGQTTTYAVEYDLGSSLWCTSGESLGSPANSTAAQTLGFTDTASHSVSVGVSGLTPGTSYCLDLVATNSSGSGDGGQVALTAGVPSTQSSDAIATGASTATVDGTINPGGQSTTYRVRYDLATSVWCTSGESLGAPAFATTPQTLAFTDTTSHPVSVNLSGLTAGTSYCVDLVATNAVGTGDGGQIALSPGAPNAYTADATPTGASTASIDGTVNPLGQTMTYTVEYDLASSTWCTSGGSLGSPANSTAAQTLGFTDTASHTVSVNLSGLTPGASYCVDLVATNSSGTGDGGQIALTAGIPSALTSSVTSTGASTASVAGSVNPGGQTTTYSAEYDLAGSPWCASGEVTGSPANTTTAQTLAFADTTSHTVSVNLTGLTAGASYCVDLVATNAAGTADGGQVALVPGAPSANTVDAIATGPSTASIDGTVNPLGQTTTYTLEYDLASSSWCFSGGSLGSPANSTTAQTLGFTDGAQHGVSISLTSLTAGTVYCVDLVATNPSGTSDGGQISLTTSGGPTPPAVTTSSATGLSTSGATMAGTVNPNGLTTSYYFQYGTASSYGSITASANAGSGNSPLPESAALTNLTANTTYHYRLVATSAAGTTKGSDQTFTTSPAPVAPTVTTGPATGVSAGNAAIAGTVNPNGLATSYQFQYGTTTSYGSITTSANAGSGTSPLPESVTLTNLTANTTYHYRLVATSTAGTTNGADQTLTTSPAAATPVAPAATTGSATGGSASGATIAGTVNPHGLATTYQFQYGTSTSYGSTTTSVSAGSGASPLAESATLTGLTAETTYHYRLVATSSAGTTNGSDRTFTTTHAAATPVAPPAVTPVDPPAAPKTPTPPNTPPSTPHVSSVHVTATTLSLHLSEPATVTVAITTMVKARVCTNAAKKNSRCAPSSSRASLTLHGGAGANHFKLRVSRLAPGRYSATVTARNAGGLVSQPVTFTLTIPKPKKR